MLKTWAIAPERVERALAILRSRLDKPLVAWSDGRDGVAPPCPSRRGSLSTTGSPGAMSDLSSRVRHRPIMDSLQGHLLIASPGLLDPNFARTVLLIAVHGEDE